MKKTLKTLAITAVLGTALVGGMAFAQGPGNGPGQGWGGGYHGYGYHAQEFTGPGADELNALRDEHRASMQTIRDQHQTEMKALMEKHGNTGPANGPCPSGGPGKGQGPGMGQGRGPNN